MFLYHLVKTLHIVISMLKQVSKYKKYGLNLNKVFIGLVSSASRNLC